MRLAVIGTGYVGLVAGTGFSDLGNHVTCVDLDAARVERLRRGEIPIHEPGLAALVEKNLAAGRLHFTTRIAEAVAGAEAVFLAVGTPPRADGSCDLSQVLAAAAEVGQHLTGEAIVVTKSTVPVGTADLLRQTLAAVCPHPVAVASNPEFLKEGSAVDDFLQPMRVVVGLGEPGRELSEAEDRARQALRRLYDPIASASDCLLFMDTRSAELTKYACNAYLATRLSFINDIAGLCERTGADVEAVRCGMGMDTRIGPQFLAPGMGYGGSCFPKDVQALLVTGRAHGQDLPIVAAAHAVNERQKVALFDKILRHFDGPASTGEGDSALPLAGRTIAIWGLAFKPETDDVREAPALALIERLLAAGATVRATDPVALHTTRWHFVEKVQTDMGIAAAAEYSAGTDRRILPLTLHSEFYEAARGADALVLCTEWRRYRAPSWERLRAQMTGRVIFDGRNLWDPAEVRAEGFTYCGIGRP